MSRLEPLMDAKEVAAYLKKDVRTIKKWVHDGDLKCSSVPKNVLRFDADYIRSLGEIKFRNNISSPEVFRLKKEYEKVVKEKDQKILQLKSIIREFYIQGLKSINLIEE